MKVYGMETLERASYIWRKEENQANFRGIYMEGLKIFDEHIVPQYSLGYAYPLYWAPVVTGILKRLVEFHPPIRFYEVKEVSGGLNIAFECDFSVRDHLTKMVQVARSMVDERVQNRVGAMLRDERRIQ